MQGIIKCIPASNGLLTIATLILTTIPSVSFCQDVDAEAIMNTVSARYDRHANGHIQFHRKIYFQEGVTLDKIKETTGIVDKWASPQKLVVDDANDFYWEKQDGPRRYRWDAKNLLKENVDEDSLATHSQEMAHSIVRNYDRTYVSDPLNNEQIIVYRTKKNSKPLSLIRLPYKPTEKIGPPYIYDAGLLPVNMIFSRYANWAGWRKREKKPFVIKEVKESRVWFSLDAGEEFYNIQADVKNNILLFDECIMNTGQIMIGPMPTIRMSFSDYKTFESEFLPAKVRSQFYMTDPTKKSRILSKALPMAITTIEIEVMGLEFDNPQFSEMISMSEFKDVQVVDTRFDRFDPAYYKARPDLTDAEILSMKDKEKTERRIRELTRPALWGAGIAVFFFALGFWYFRGKRRDSQLKH